MSDYIHPERLRGYFITFTTYGTRLHGDARGTVDDQTNGFGDENIGHLPKLVRADAAQLKHAPIMLDEARRRSVAGSIAEVCAYRGWELRALNVRTNHVHVMVVAERAPEDVMDAFTAYATRALRRGGLVPPTYTVWSRHGSTRYLWNDAVVEAVRLYITEGQGPDLPGGTISAIGNARDPEARP